MTPEESNLDYTDGRSLCTVARGRGTLIGVPPELNTTIPHSARIYDYLLGGKDNFEADRSAAGAIVEASPSLPISMRANRQYMARVAHHLAAERGIRQFLDVGTGLPTSPNLHEVVQAVDPKSRVVYVDNDPIVLVHARALLTTQPEGATAYIDADLRDTRSILGADDLIKTLDLGRPVSVSLIAVLQFITEEADAHRIIDELMAPMPAGSTLAISTVTAHNEQAVAGARAYSANGIQAKPRTDGEVAALFDGLDLTDPGVVLVNRWRPGPEDAEVDDHHVQMSGAVGVKR
jgi:hypothetical protein